MSTKRFFYVMAGTLVLLIALIVGAAIGGNSLLQKQSAKLTQLKVNAKALERQQVLLLQAKRDIEKYSELERVSKTIVPQDKDQAKTVREITAIAAQNNIPIKSIDFPASTLGDVAPKLPATSEGEGSAATAPKKPAISQVAPVQGIPGVYSLEVRISSNGEVPYRNLVGFLEGLENNRRTAHVAKVDVDPSENGSAVKFVLTLNAYLKP